MGKLVSLSESLFLVHVYSGFPFGVIGVGVFRTWLIQGILHSELNKAVHLSLSLFGCGENQSPST